jgi:alpha-amylase
VDANGVVTAKKAGTAKITVKTKSGKQTVCKVTVPANVKKIKLNKKKLTLKVKKSYRLKATLKPSGIKDTLTWKSSNKKVASVDKNGKIKAKKKGKAVITVTTSNGKKATCKVTVKK